MPINKFEVEVYGNLLPFEKNELLSLARVRIFYKGLNRNRTFITDEFAEKLLASLPYTPVSGIWRDGDFTDHGETREEGRIYGIVPEEPNVQWESHLDADGVMRTYACCDVALFTARYEHASDIVGKSHSMELYDKSIKGEWTMVDGVKCYKFTDGVFIGLQALGDMTEPCFEGSAFYTYANSLKEMIDTLKQYSIGRKTQMEMPNFALSDREKYEQIFNILNIDYIEKDGDIRYGITEIYDDYFIAFDYATGKYMKFAYTKDDAAVSIAENAVEVAVEYVSFDELIALRRLREMNGDTYEKIDEAFKTAGDNVYKLTADNEQLNATIATLQDTVNTGAQALEERNVTINTLNADIAAANDKIATYEAQIEELTQFKNGIIKEQKQEEIAKYAMLPAETIKNFNNTIDNYTLEELQNALKIAYVNANGEAIFSQKTNLPEQHLVSTSTGNGQELTGAAKLVADFQKKNGGKK